jgi:hypothetical protein
VEAGVAAAATTSEPAGTAFSSDPPVLQ